jgi:hypothetical protein
MSKQRWIDTYLGKYKWYRKLVGGVWYKHKFTRDAQEICVTFIATWWARYAELNRYTKVVEVETYGGGEQ